MGYKAVINEPSYLCHFNKNHDPKNGRFTFKKALETIDTAVGNGYDAVEKVGRGLGKGTVTAVKSIKKSFETPEQKPKTEVPPMKQPTGEPYSPKQASEFKTAELDSDYKELKALNIPAQHDLAWLDDNDDASTKWPKDYAEAVDIGIKALNNTRYKNEFGDKITNSDRNWFVFEDQTIGYPEVAYLLYKGHSADDVRSITKKVINLEDANYEYIQQYYGSKEFMDRLNDMPYETNALWNLSEYSSRGTGGDEKFEEECLRLINNQKAQHSLDMSEDSLEDRRNRYKTISEDFGISDAIKDKNLTKSYTDYINSIAKAQKIDKEATDAALKGDMVTYEKLEQKAQKAGNKVSGLEKKYDEDVSRVAEEIIGKYANKKLSKEYKYSEAVEQIINAVIFEHI